MALANPLEAFVWGAGGSKKTPEQVAREREIAAALMQGGMDYSPVDHWLQGAARAAQGGVGALKDRWAGEAETAGRDGFQSRWDSVFGGGQGAPVQTAAIDPVAAALVGTPQTASDATAAMASAPSGDNAGYIRQGLVSRGLPEHVADAFVMNFQDESGLNPGINEAAPTVPGSRGGYGLYQLTGPRRVAYEQYASQQGVDPSNVDAQLDFMMSELQGPEAAAAQSILSAPDTGSAAAAIVNKFLRPAEEHRARRVAQYTGGAGMPTGGGNASPLQMAQSPDMAALLGLASDPWANDAQRSIVESLMGQQMQQQDPMYQLQMQAAQQGLTKGDLEIQQLLNPAAPKPIEVGGVLLDPTTYQPLFDSRQGGSGLINAGGGQIYDPNSGNWITAPDTGAGAPDLVELFDDVTGLPYKATFNPETGAFDRVGGVKAPSGTQLSVDPSTGAVTFQQGSGLKPLTEGQSKDTVYATRAEGALPIIDALGNSLTDLRTSVTGQTPMVGNFTKSPEYQQAEQAGTEFLQAILRKDTGAAITPDETAEYGKVYLPRPGDSPQLLEQKRVSRTRALEAIKAGLPPNAILAQEQALLKSGGPGMTSPQQSQATQVNTEAEYNALPSGAVYVDPTGQIRTKR